MNPLAQTDPQRPGKIAPQTAYGLSLALTAAATLTAVIADALAPIPNLSLIFVLPVVIAAVSFGFGPAMAAALAGTAAYNFLLIAPRYTFRVAEVANLWALALLILTAAMVSALAAQSRRRAILAWDAADQALALRAFARSLVGATERAAIATAGAETLSRLFRAPAVVLTEEGGGLALAASSQGAACAEADLEAAGWRRPAPTSGPAPIR